MNALRNRQSDCRETEYLSICLVLVNQTEEGIQKGDCRPCQKASRDHLHHVEVRDSFYQVYRFMNRYGLFRTYVVSAY